MDRKILLKPVVCFMFFIYGSQLFAEKFFLYDSIRWFDMPMHFLGGFWVTLFFFWFFSSARLPFVRQPIRAVDRQSIYHAILFLFLVGISWEAGEYLTTNYIGLEPWSMLDTLGDILFDVAGAAGAPVAILYYMKTIMRTTENKVQSS